MSVQASRITPDDMTGIVGILPTPSTLDADRWDCEHSVGLGEVAAMTDRVRRGGVSILMTGGSFGEGASLLDHEHEALTASVADALRGARMWWAQEPMFPGGRLENFVDYNIPIAHGRLEGSGLVASGPPRPPYLFAPDGYVEGGPNAGGAGRGCARSSRVKTG